MRILTRISLLVPAVAIALSVAACGGSGGASCGLYQNCQPTHTPPPVATDCSAMAPVVSGNAQVGLNLSGLGSCNDSTYGVVLAYTATGGSSQVIKATAGSNIVFINNDTSLDHTADFLASSLPFPAAYGGGSERAQSPAGTSINNAAFSTGTLTHGGGTSPVYKVPAAPGTITLIGCFFHYDSNGMRTVVIAQ